MTVGDPAGHWTWQTILNAGWFGVVVGLLLFLAGIGVSYFFYRRSLPTTRLRFAQVDNELVGASHRSSAEGLEFTFHGVAIPRVTSTTVGFWNGGSTTIGADSIAALDLLRIDLTPPAQLLDVVLEAHTRQVIGAELSAQSASSVTVGFDYLDPGDGFRLKVLHTGDRDSAVVKGTIRGMPEGIERQRVGPGGSVAAEFGKTALVVGSTIVVASGALKIVPNQIVPTLTTAAAVALVLFALFAPWLKMRWWKVSRGSLIPTVILDDDALYGQVVD